MELAEKLRQGLEAAGRPAGRNWTCNWSVSRRRPPIPNGCHVCEVEVDPETGLAEIVRYTMVNDFGVMINPMLVEGQAHGGIVQGIGQALKESRGL